MIRKMLYKSERKGGGYTVSPLKPDSHYQVRWRLIAEEGKPSLDVAKPDTILGRPIRTSSFMPGIAKGEKVLLFGDLKNYWVADRQNRTFRRLNELYARTDQVGFLTTQRVDGRLILPESVKVLKMAGTKATNTTPTTDPDDGANG